MTPWVIAGWYLLASVVSFGVFAWDKAAAAAGTGPKGRVRERTLHLLSLAGGWPGSIAAMLLLRHKVRKPGFVTLTGLCIVVHAAIWIVVIARHAR